MFLLKMSISPFPREFDSNEYSHVPYLIPYDSSAIHLPQCSCESTDQSSTEAPASSDTKCKPISSDLFFRPKAGRGDEVRRKKKRSKIRNSQYHFMLNGMGIEEKAKFDMEVTGIYIKIHNHDVISRMCNTRLIGG